MKKDIETKERDRHFAAFVEWYKKWKKSPYSNESRFEKDCGLHQGMMNKYCKSVYRPRLKRLNKIIQAAHRIGLPENYLADYEAKRKTSKK